MVDDVLKYRTGNIIILYCYIYSGLLGIMKDFIQDSIELIGSIGLSPQINK